MRATSVALLLAACLALGAAQEAQRREALRSRRGLPDAPACGPRPYKKSSYCKIPTESTWNPLELEPVPAGRALLQDAAGAGGGYGGGYGGEYGGGGYGGPARRRLAEGGYGGGYGGEYGGGGYGAAAPPRLLMELDPAAPDAPAAAAAARRQQQQERERLASAGAAAERRAQRQREAGAADAAAAAAADAAAPAAAVAAALRGARAAAASGAMAAPPGQCYCRYDADYNTWALAEEPCKSALAAKCAAGQLPCAWLDAYHGHAVGGGMAHTLPHEQDILGFVFDDCQPHPPCACAGVKFDGSDAVTNSYACCRDLRAACRTPFNGLACADVDAFCKDDAAGAALLHWAQHKLHRASECAAYKGLPYDFVPLGAMAAANAAAREAAAEAADAAAGAPTAADETAALLTEAAAAAGARAAGRSRAAAAAVGLGGLLVGVAIVGMMLTLRGGAPGAGADASGAAAPLLHTVPEVSRDEDEAHGALRHIISSNYLLASTPPSRNASAASLASSAPPQQ
ncbi:MAG: hypothetical protein J3K34DRAFT_498391 [Monoraphidium minutum]|nr:MAG: hypothetical protein J3K34DRAFT_498391 [Monoraphidium minutum]